ncbi:MAG: hypothetical protein OXF83_03125 [Anaerolineaceae bacterium]|nr:hypothetical protein [Anaerolineaceae bacterium]
MTQITVHADCGHLPNDGHSAKKQLLRDLNIAFARAAEAMRFWRC